MMKGIPVSAILTKPAGSMKLPVGCCWVGDDDDLVLVR